MTSDPSSLELVAKAQRGDLDAIGRLFDEHYQDMLRYFWSRSGDLQKAEDLTSEVFKRMLTGLPGYRSMGLPFRAWLFRIAHNQLIDNYRQGNRQPMTSLQEIESSGDADSNPALIIEHSLTFEDAHKALTELEPSQRDVLALRFLSGLSLKETALALNKTEDAVKGLQRRGLAALRLRLGLE